jgi:hypothetical protein
MKVSLMALVAGFCLVVGLPLAAMAGPTPGGANSDGDAIENAFDNCTGVSNPNQKDFDHDGCGDVCDGDLTATQDGSSGAADFTAFKAAFGSSEGSPAYNPRADMDCNGAVGAGDFTLFKGEFTTTSGPSGITNAGRNFAICP